MVRLNGEGNEGLLDTWFGTSDICARATDLWSSNDVERWDLCDVRGGFGESGAETALLG